MPPPPRFERTGVTKKLHPNLNYIGFEDFLTDVRVIMAAVRTRGWIPDYIVGVGRGGLGPALFISHGLDLPMLSVDHSSRLFDFAEELLDKLAGLTREGKKLLFVDDINDSGTTLAYIRMTLDEHGAEDANIRVAVLINNLRSRNKVDYFSREIDRQTHKDWFVFPWEAMAATETLMEEANKVPERLA